MAVIAIDFDGTCVTHEYPNVGKDIGAQFVLKELIRNGHELILYTMRSGRELQDAFNWFYDNDIELWAINNNPGQKLWTKSPKIYANLYIDDAALGVPLIKDKNVERPYVNWESVFNWLLENGYLEYTKKEYETIY